MNDTSKTPEELAGRWRLAAQVPDAVRRLIVQPDGMDLVLLVADGEGDWWSVSATCRACGTLLEPKSSEVTEPADVVTCTACGAAHGPQVADAATLPTLVSDDEIYVLCEGQKPC